MPHLSPPVHKQGFQFGAKLVVLGSHALINCSEKHILNRLFIILQISYSLFGQENKFLFQSNQSIQELLRILVVILFTTLTPGRAQSYFSHSGATAGNSLTLGSSDPPCLLTCP